MSYTIFIGNKAYSSWSMRPYLVLHHFGLPFAEVLVPLDEPDTRERLLAFSPTAKVPVLIDGDLSVWDSLAMIEYLAERHPDVAIWPKDSAARATARSLAAEMHAGFAGLRSACPMNLRKVFPFRPRGGERAKADVARFSGLVGNAIAHSGGPFLFGEWCAVDAMYTPLAARITGYGWPVDEVTAAYVDALLLAPSALAWRDAALKETWIIAADEADD